MIICSGPLRLVMLCNCVLPKHMVCLPQPLVSFDINKPFNLKPSCNLLP